MSDTVLLMVDMQNMYLDQTRRDAFGWPPIYCFGAIVAECRALLDHAHSQNLPVIFTRHVSRPDGADATPAAKHLASLASSIPSNGRDPAWSSQILDDLAPTSQDIVIQKLRWDAFFGTELDQILRNLSARRLVIAGLQTNVCVETTARTAMMKNFSVGIPSDAVSTDGRALHENALDALRVLYAEVAPWRELLAPGAEWRRAFTTPHYGRKPEDFCQRADHTGSATGG